MSPRAPDQQVREELLKAAAEMLVREGPKALSTRRLAAKVGTSTMAVYTHFGGMDGLRREVRVEGFAKLSEHFDRVTETEDPVADLTALGWAYCFNAVTNPQLYRAVFFEQPIDEEDVPAGRATVERPIGAVARCIEAGRFAPADPEALAIQTWVAGHGMIATLLARLLTLEELIEHLPAMGRNLYVGFGDDPELAERSVARAQERMVDLAPTF